jgi:hypothetical protein
MKILLVLLSCFALANSQFFDYQDYYNAMLDYALYDYYDWVCSGTQCQLCDLLTGDCCDPAKSRNCFLPDSCANNPCLAGGTCITTRTVSNQPDFVCTCKKGLTGKYCQLIDEYDPPIVLPGLPPVAAPFAAPVPVPAPVQAPVPAPAPAPQSNGMRSGLLNSPRQFGQQANIGMPNNGMGMMNNGFGMGMQNNGMGMMNNGMGMRSPMGKRRRRRSTSNQRK